MAIVKANNGYQTVHRFENGYGASVVCGPYTYGGPDGLYELGVIKFVGDEWTLTYETPITDDVIGFLTPEAVKQTLALIEALPAQVSA